VTFNPPNVNVIPQVTGSKHGSESIRAQFDFGGVMARAALPSLMAD
jgi:hypothetical protein